MRVISDAGTAPDAALDGEDLTEALSGRSAARKEGLFWEWRFGYVGDPIGWSPALARCARAV